MVFVKAQHMNYKVVFVGDVPCSKLAASGEVQKAIDEHSRAGFILLTAYRQPKSFTCGRSANNRYDGVMLIFVQRTAS